MNSNRPKEIWKIIHRISNPNPKNIIADPNTLKNNFIENAKRLTGKHAAKQDELFNMVETVNYKTKNNFKLSHITYGEVLREIRSLRGDCSTDPDNIPTSTLKLVSDVWISKISFHYDNLTKIT